MEKKKIVLILILIIIILLIIYFSYRIFSTYRDDNKIKKELTDIKNEVIINENKNEEEEPEENKEVTQNNLELDFTKLKKINKDTVAWIRIYGTDIDYPIVQTDNNNYYLNHSFYNEINMNGWIFENSNNSNDFSDENTILFGHNTNSTTMFSELKGIYQGDYGNNITISIYLENSIINYKVFSIYQDNPNNTTSISEYTNSYTLNEMLKKSNINFNSTIDKKDKIITLSTCNNITNDRIIMHAKRV